MPGLMQANSAPLQLQENRASCALLIRSLLGRFPLVIDTGFSLALVYFFWVAPGISLLTPAALPGGRFGGWSVVSARQCAVDPCAPLRACLYPRWEHIAAA